MGREICAVRLENGCVMRVVEGDLTRLEVDAVVNAANSSLMGGGGVDGAIHRAGGPEILEECKEIVAARGRLPTGQAVITTAGAMPSRFVVHTVGPVYGGDDDRDSRLLASCYRESLERALENGCASVAFPGISTGVYGYPIAKACPVAVAAVRQFLLERNAPAEVVFCTFGRESTEAYEALLGSTAPVPGKNDSSSHATR